MRIATWNLKQAVAPKKPLPDLWEWAEKTIDPDIIVLTEARVPKTGLPSGWSAHFREGGIGPRRSWGTIVAGRGLTLERVTYVTNGRKRYPLDNYFPGTMIVTDVIKNGKLWATVVGMHSLCIDPQGEKDYDGSHTTQQILDDLDLLLRSGRDRIIAAGDLNLHPDNCSYDFQDIGLVDLVKATSKNHPDLPNAIGGSLLWTHKNGNGPNSAVQQIDYIFATPNLIRRTPNVYGGVSSFSDAWTMSDHAPVVAEIDY